MKSSFKVQLHSLVRSNTRRGRLTTLNAVHKFALSKGKKQSTAERTLRPSESPNVDTVYNKKGHVKGYMWGYDTDVFKNEK